MHVHGGWFNWGSAQAFRSLVGHIALNAGAGGFIPDYRLAPEHPFPVAVKVRVNFPLAVLQKRVGFTQLLLDVLPLGQPWNPRAWTSRVARPAESFCRP
jgi:hypothetical protein